MEEFLFSCHDCSRKTLHDSLVQSKSVPECRPQDKKFTSRFWGKESLSDNCMTNFFFALAVVLSSIQVASRPHCVPIVPSG